MPSGHVLIMCMAFQLLQNMASGHVKVKKGTGHVFYIATPSHATESACGLETLGDEHLRANLLHNEVRLSPILKAVQLFVCPYTS